MKKRLRSLLEVPDFEAIAEWAFEKHRLLNVLISLTFDRDPLVGWRAVEAMGACADRLARDKPDWVSDHLRRLYWLINEESGGVCWRSPEAMATIIRRQPELCAEYVPIVSFLLQSMAEEDLDHFRPGSLWAIGHLGPLVDEHLEEILPTVVAAISHSDPQVRGMAVWCLGEVGRANILVDHPNLLDDEGPVDLYEDHLIKQTRVAALARRITSATD